MGRKMQYTFSPVPLHSRFTTVKVPSFIANDETVLNDEMAFFIAFDVREFETHKTGKLCDKLIPTKRATSNI
jgi:hypothetical protein